MKFLRFAVLCFGIIGLSIGCSGGGSGGGGSISPNQLRGHWIAGYYKTKNTEVTADDQGFFDGSKVGQNSGKVKLLLTIDDKEMTTTVMDDKGFAASDDVQDYRIDGGSIVAKSKDGKESRATIHFIGNSMEVDGDDGSVSRFTKLSDDEFAKHQSGITNRGGVIERNNLQTLSIKMSVEGRNGKIIESEANHTSDEGHVYCSLANNKSLVIGWMNKDSRSTGDTIHLDLTWDLSLDRVESTHGHIVEEAKIPNGAKIIFSANFADPQPDGPRFLMSDSLSKCVYDFNYTGRHLQGTYSCNHIAAVDTYNFKGTVSGNYDCDIE